jgi:hypothetical protein
MQEQTFLVSKFRMDMEAQVAQIHAKLDQIQRNALPSMREVPLNCKFCGAKIEQGNFCPECGKAQA